MNLYYMTYTCPLCALDPSSHSFTKVLENKNNLYYYTCPSKAKLYFDKIGILKHYDGILSEMPKNKNWIWIFDGTNYGLHHFLQIELAIDLAKLITSKFSDNLNKIIIINPTIYIRSIYNVVKPFLSEKINSLIEINYGEKTIDDVIKI